MFAGSAAGSIARSTGAATARQGHWSSPEGRAELRYQLLEVRELGPLTTADLAEALLETEQSEVPLPPDLTLSLAASVASDWPSREPVPAVEVDATVQAYRRLLTTEQRAATVQYLLAPLLGHFVGRGEPGRAIEVVEDGIGALDLGHVLRPYFAHQLIDLHLTRGDVDAALATAREAIDEASDHGADEQVQSALAGMFGVAQLFRGLPDQAAGPIADDFRFQLARVEAEEPLNLGFLLAAHIHQADLYLVTDRMEDLLQEVAPALEHPEWFVRAPAARPQVGVRVGLAHVGLAFRSSELGAAGVERHLAEAGRLFREALDDPHAGEIERLRCEIWLAFTAQREERWADSAELLDRARERLSPALESDGRERRWLAVLRVRAARALGWSGGLAAAAEEDLRAVHRGLNAWWQAQESRRGGLGPLRDPTDRWVVAEAARLASSDGGQAAALAVLEAPRRAGSLARDLGVGGLPAAGAGSTLAPGGGALVFFPLWFEPTVVIATDARGVERFEVAPLVELQPLLREYSGLLESAPPVEASARRARTEELRRIGGELGDRLFTPALRAHVGDWNALVLVGRDLLDDFVFEGLPWDGSWLGTRFAVSYLPSLEMGFALRARTAPVERPDAEAWMVTEPELGAAVRAAHAELGPLGLSSEERDALQPPEAWSLRSLSGAEATLAALRDARPGSYLQVFTHGVRDASRERSAGLVLAPAGEHSGLAFSEDVELLHAPGLVVLAACGSGRGPMRQGDGGVSDLSGAFLRAGARTVVLSSTNLAVDAVVRMLPPFHAALGEGAGVAEALRRARASLAQDEAFSDPFFHGLWVAVGDANQPVLETTPRPQPGLSDGVYWAMALAAAGIVVAGLVRRSRLSA